VDCGDSWPLLLIASFAGAMSALSATAD